MGKNKLKKFAENRTFDHVIEPELDNYFTQDHPIKGRWSEQMFHNDNPIVLELGCGKGEYAVEMAAKYPNKNFIGIDIKGARIWRGAKTVAEKGMSNICFLRMRIEFLHRFFDANEVSEIWITFPDPQRKKRRRKKRLTYSGFLTMYQQFLKPENVVHLKTDSLFMHNYTKEVIAHNNLNVLACTANLYESNLYTNELKIKTHYEALYLEGNPTITYLKFEIDKNVTLKEPETEDEEFWEETTEYQK
ncbi:MAG: tRNA (guanosine(46)-N7)-methyltransferase TrmB [Salinivirgaceae bacterium]